MRVAAEAGHRVHYAPASKLVNEPVEAADGKQLFKTIARYGGAISFAGTSFGYMELDRRVADCCSRY